MGLPLPFIEHWRSSRRARLVSFGCVGKNPENVGASGVLLGFLQKLPRLYLDPKEPTFLGFPIMNSLCKSLER